MTRTIDFDRDSTSASSETPSTVKPWLVTGVLLASLFGATGTSLPARTSSRFIFPQAVSSTSLEELLSVPGVTATDDLRVAVQTLHSLSGLSWEQLAKLFNVSRRAVHKWAAGGAMNSANAERLASLHATFASLGSNPTEVRSRLMAPDAHGSTLFQTMIERVSAPGVSLDQRMGVRLEGDVTVQGTLKGSKRSVVQPKKID